MWVQPLLLVLGSCRLPAPLYFVGLLSLGGNGADHKRIGLVRLASGEIGE